jgi:protein TonB
MSRTLHYAIALSIALHGVILFGLSVEPQVAVREAPRPPIEARLVEPPAPPAPVPPPAAPVPPAPPPRKLEPVKPEPAPARPKPKSVAKPQPKAVTKPEPPQPSPPAIAADPEPLPAPAVEAPAPAAPPVARVEPRPGPSAEELEAATREQYRLQILEQARSFNRYPPLARENNWEGQALVRMEVAPDGRVSLALAESSGHPVLDRQALEMFRRAQARVPLPASLRGKAFSVELRAIYRLKDQVSG